MTNRDPMDLHKELIQLFSPNKVYYNPPETIAMTYPCIVYNKDYIKTNKADNLNFVLHDRYQLTVIDRDPDNTAIKDILLHFQTASFDRRFVSDGLYHDVITLYY